MLVSLNLKKSWETPWYRGDNAPHVSQGQLVMVLQQWMIGDRVRMSLLTGDRVVMCSTSLQSFWSNWQLADGIILSDAASQIGDRAR